MGAKQVLLLAGVFAALAVRAAERTLLFSDDFESPESFSENWQKPEPNHIAKSILVGGGCVKFPNCGGIKYQGEMPAEFDAEMDIVLFPSWSEKPDDWKSGARWAGFDSDYGNFSVKVVAGSVAVGASAAIEANQKGYMLLDVDTPPDAPGVGYSFTNGASHGGVGGGDSASSTYGQRLAPLQPGSPGGCYNTYGNINRKRGRTEVRRRMVTDNRDRHHHVTKVSDT